MLNSFEDKQFFYRDIFDKLSFKDYQSAFKLLQNKKQESHLKKIVHQCWQLELIKMSFKKDIKNKQILEKYNEKSKQVIQIIQTLQKQQNYETNLQKSFQNIFNKDGNQNQQLFIYFPQNIKNYFINIKNQIQWFKQAQRKNLKQKDFIKKQFEIKLEMKRDKIKKITINLKSLLNQFEDSTEIQNIDTVIRNIRRNIDQLFAQNIYLKNKVKNAKNVIEQKDQYSQYQEQKKQIYQKNAQKQKCFYCYQFQKDIFHLKDQIKIMTQQSSLNQNKKKQQQQLCQNCLKNNKKYSILDEQRINKIIQINSNTKYNKQRHLEEEINEQNKIILHPYTSLHFFTGGGTLGLNNSKEIMFAKTAIEQFAGHKIKWTHLLYRADSLNKINFHQYIDKHPNLVFLLNTELGFIAGYSPDCLSITQPKIKPTLLLSLSNQTILHNPLRGSVFLYQYLYFIFGDQEIKFKNQSDVLLTKYNSFSADYKINEYMKQVKMSGCQFYEIQFE